MTQEPRYTHEQWERLLESSIAEIRRLATLKGGEYAGDTDHLANFRSAAEDQNLPMETIWRVYAGKHWDAISQYCKDILARKDRPRAESISGRLDDLIVYSLLMKAMVEERESLAKPQGLTLHVTEITGQFPDLAGRGGWESKKTYTVQPGDVLGEIPSPQRPRLLDPQCPATGEAHQWQKMNRYTDCCVAPGCGAMRPHERRR